MAVAPGYNNYETAQHLLASVGEIPSNDDKTNPAADRAIAEAHVQATLALWEILTDIADELAILRKQREG